MPKLHLLAPNFSFISITVYNLELNWLAFLNNFCNLCCDWL